MSMSMMSTFRRIVGEADPTLRAEPPPREPTVRTPTDEEGHDEHEHDEQVLTNRGRGRPDPLSRAATPRAEA